MIESDVSAFDEDNQDGSPCPTISVPFTYPDDEANTEDDAFDLGPGWTPAQVRKMKHALQRAQDDARLEAFRWMSAWLSSAGIIGLKSQAVALAYALKLFPDKTICQLAECSGVLKQTAHLSLERLNEVLPKLFILGIQDDDRIKNQAKAMSDSWRRRKKKNPPATTQADSKNKHESQGGLQ